MISGMKSRMTRERGETENHISELSMGITATPLAKDPGCKVTAHAMTAHTWTV